eukprot:CAMPEP_0179084702 /NCGR_PEP_ID=MMETSP0796-20121207/38319_1 /TAXON_ID=73915 /ORGANISM="Pyrodinium bahamense, Strain pbaha01" /LENGTH=122 /DNA_ID=CAMNT_0020782127 /DNA_START=139 /DNA_END=504 /DNA_ORIENTATION=-
MTSFTSSGLKKQPVLFTSNKASSPPHSAKAISLTQALVRPPSSMPASPLLKDTLKPSNHSLALFATVFTKLQASISLAAARRAAGSLSLPGKGAGTSSSFADFGGGPPSTHPALFRMAANFA